MPAAAPWSPNSTASTSGVSGTIEMAAAAPAAASAGVAAARPPCSDANRSALAESRVQTLSSRPAPARFAAIGQPMIPRPRKAMRSGLSMSTTSGCLDSKSVAGLQLPERLAGYLRPVQEVPTRLAGLAARGLGRAVAPALRDQRVAHRLERLELADHAVAAAVRAAAARAAT